MWLEWVNRLFPPRMNFHCLILGFPAGCGLPGVPEHPSLYVPEQWGACHVRAVRGPGPLRLQLPRRPLLLLREGQRSHVRAVPDVASVSPCAGARCGTRERGGKDVFKARPTRSCSALSSDGTPERAASGARCWSPGILVGDAGPCRPEIPFKGWGTRKEQGFKAHFVVPFRAG